jgi:hypothetical protein
MIAIADTSSSSLGTPLQELPIKSSMAYIVATAANTIINSRIGRRSGAFSVASCGGVVESWLAARSREFSFCEDIDPGAGGTAEVSAGFSGPAAPLIR